MAPTRAPPKAPRAKAPTKAATKAATGTLGVRRRPNKPRAPLQQPEGMSDADWQRDCIRRQFSTTERNGRRKKEMLVLATTNLAALAGGYDPAGHDNMNGVRSRSSSPSESPHPSCGTSPHPSCGTPRSQSRFSQSPRISPEFAEQYGGGYGYGGFDPNTMFSPTGVAVDLNEAYQGSPAMRRGVAGSGEDAQSYAGRSLPFSQGGSTVFGEMSGVFNVNEMHADTMNDMINDAQMMEEEGGEGEGEEEGAQEECVEAGDGDEGFLDA